MASATAPDAADAGLRLLTEEETILAEVALVAFGVAFFMAIRVLVRSGRPGHSGSSPVVTGMRTRKGLIVRLLVASAARCLAIAAELALNGAHRRSNEFLGLDAVQQNWALDLLEFVPAFAFLSAFSVIVLFWAQLHYTTNMVPFPLSDCVFFFLSVASYILLFVITLCTLLLKVYSHFCTYVMSVVGFLNIAVAVSMLYYGILVAWELHETAKNKLPGKHLGIRVMLISVVCPGALLVRGGCYMGWGIGLGKRSKLLELVFCLVGEWLPLVLALAILSFFQGGAIKPSTASLDDSTDSEAPLLTESEPMPQLTGVLGANWKQLYPAPAAAPSTP
mmetsp:Transcript_78765/g.218935  ORF Transcript_78765/g.218935 Transcript_78765/m.218935 type:complete len:335 (+) Transcript_78765:88-1092(+)